MSDPYVELKAYFDSVEGAEVNRGTGSQGIKHGKKMFAMFLKGDLLVQLPPARVAEVIPAGERVATRKIGLRYSVAESSPQRSMNAAKVAGSICGGWSRTEAIFTEWS